MSERRAFTRVHGPFDGVRLGLLDVNLRIYDLSAGGCFVESLIEAKVGETLNLRIDLSEEGWIEVGGVVVPSERTLGYAVRFVDLDEADRDRIIRTVARVSAGSAPPR